MRPVSVIMKLPFNGDDSSKLNVFKFVVLILTFVGQRNSRLGLLVPLCSPPVSGTTFLTSGVTLRRCLAR